MLRNNLKSAIEIEPLNALLETLEINPQTRAEDLSVEQWVQLSNAFNCDATLMSSDSSNIKQPGIQSDSVASVEEPCD